MRRLLILAFVAAPTLGQPIYPPVSSSSTDGKPTTCNDGEILVASSSALVCSSASEGLLVNETDGAYGSSFYVPEGFGLSILYAHDAQLSTDSAALFGRTVFTANASGEGAASGVMGSGYLQSASGGYPSGVYGGYFTAEKWDAGAGGSIFGTLSTGYALAGSGSTVVGGQYFAGTFGGSATNATALAVQVSEFGASDTITKGIGLSVDGFSGTITSSAGVLVNSTGGGGANETEVLIGTTSIPSGKYSIYSASALRSFFDGPVTVDDYLAIDPQASPPSSPSLGWIYVDSDINLPCFYNGTGWVQMDDFSTACS